MRPKKFGSKPSSNSIERFKRTTRITPFVSKVGSHFQGTPQQKARNIALVVSKRIPLDEDITWFERKRVFRRNAHDSLMHQKAIGFAHCAERCNLAIALLNAAGVRAWLARVIMVPEKRVKGKINWHFHDVVEFMDGKHISRIMFDNIVSEGVLGHIVLPGAVDSKYEGIHSPIVFRGADSKQIGGVGNWEEYKKYSKRLDKPSGLASEINKNKRRIELLVKEGIIPEDALLYL
jgi:hypothetical protein